MKELSIEEKAKRYDEAIKTTRKWYDANTNEGYRGIFEDIFPELKESEDDRISNEIIQFLQLPHPQFVGKRDHEKWIAWLEKQGEQKPADKVEPKFKVGDWVVYTGYLLKDSGKEIYVMQVASVEDDRYNFTDTSTLCFDSEKDMRSWTIQDAKDGDVLCCESGWTCIFKALNSDISFSSYCFMDNTGWFCETGSEGHTLDKAFIKAYNGNIYPATKEQRDLLFQKMKESGYEWDAEKKELKKIKQKSDTQHSTEWSVSDFRTWQYIVSDVLTKKDGIGQYLDSGECKKIAKYMQEEWGEKLGKEQTQEELCKGEDYGIDGLYHAISILEKTLGKVDGYQSDDGILEHKCAINAVKEFYEQKPAWSEEDDKILKSIIINIENLQFSEDMREKYHHILNTNKSYYQIKIDWLKSLKDRVQPQPKNEWSEEDEDILNTIINHFKVDIECTDEDDVVRWLKSLKERFNK